MDINDIANERYRNLNSNDNDNEPVSGIRLEVRKHADNESLARNLQEHFNASNPEPFLAVCYSGVPRDTINRHVAKADEVGHSPVKLFMFLVGQEPQWRNYQERKVQLKGL